MMSNQRSPWWPYLLLLAGLFVLSIAVPRGWQQASAPKKHDDHWSRTKSFGDSRSARAAIAVVRPSPVAAGGSAIAALPPESKPQSPPTSTKVVPTWSAALPAISLNARLLDNPLVESVAKKIADLRSFALSTNPPAKNDSPIKITPPVKNAQSTKIEPPSTKIEPAIEKRTKQAVWPKPQSLLAQLDRLAQQPEYHAWANQTRELCLELCRPADTDTARATQILDQLDAVHLNADNLAKSGEGIIDAADFRRARYALGRRLLIWRAALSVPLQTIVPDGSIDVDDVLGSLEQYEASGLLSDALRVAIFERRLKESDDKNGQNLASCMEHVYRNANFRFAVSNELLKRLSPQQVDSAISQQTLDLLKAIDLEPTTIASEPSSIRTTMRLRLAQENQLGGHTARPQAPSDSLASIQIHDSALNNAADQLLLAGRSYTLPELFEYVAQRTNLENITAPNDLPAGVTITFSKLDPIQIHCENSAIQITITCDELRQGQNRWHDFLVSATYTPEIDKLHVRLVRLGPIQLKGAAYHGQPEIALRNIFDKILSPQQKLELVPPAIADRVQLTDLCVTQCVIEDGWIGMAMGPYHLGGHDQFARRAATDK
jgi:hypothetical protein